MNDNIGSVKDWLTVREREVLKSVAMGLSAKEIAKTLNIAPRTVERHIDHIRLKTRTRNRSHMVAYAIENGFMDV
jgi:DNA-binding CsgD family transcriptional regulator